MKKGKMNWGWVKADKWTEMKVNKKREMTVKRKMMKGKKR